MDVGRGMERAEWLRFKRRQSEQRMDTLWALMYDQDWGSYINPSHAAMMAAFLARCAPDGVILDAACGTGKYWPTILASGRRVVGYDQAAQMLARAQEKFPDVPVKKIGLQELDEEAAFDDLICMDALENVAPEDWPGIFANFRRALRPGGPLYFTVELADPAAVAGSYAKARAMGQPVVPGEYVHQPGYHYYPDLAQVRAWATAAGFRIVQ